MGGLGSSSCNRLAKVIWANCERNTCLSAIHIPGKENNETDYMSRLLHENTEWKLDPSILKLFSGIPEIYIIASHLNYQVLNYVSWNPKKKAYATDTFSISWANLKCYAFPPFSLIGISISRITREMATGIMTTPWWLTQLWFLTMVPLLQDFPALLLPKALTLPSNKELQHPLYPKTKLQAVHLSGKPSDTQNFHQKLLKLSWNHGDHRKGPHMSLNDDTTMQYQGMEIPILQM